MKTLVLIFSLIVTVSVNADVPKEAQACFALYKITASAIDYKAKGKTKQEMLSPLPPRSVIEKQSNKLTKQYLVGISMHDIVEEVYEFEALPISVYAPFVSERCVRIAQKKSVKPFSEYYDALKSCAKEKDEKQHVECAFKVFDEKNT